MIMASPAASSAGSLQAMDGSPHSSAESIAKLDNPETYCLQALQRLNLEPAVPLFYDKSQAPVGTLRAGDKNVEILTNVYGLKTHSINVYQYHLDFTKILQNGHKFLMTQEDKAGPKLPDFTIHDNRLNQGKLFDAFVSKCPKVFGQNPDNFCYDFASTLFSLDELPVVDNVTMMLDQNEVNAAIQRPYKVQLDLKKPMNNVFDIRDVMLPNEDHDLSKQPTHIIRFLELATSRYAAHHPEEHVMYESKKTFFMNPAKYGFTSPDLDNGKYLAPGASKTVVCVEGPLNKGAPALVIDSKKAPFYKAGINLLDLICEGLKISPTDLINNSQTEYINKYLKRLQVFPTYGGHQSQPITLKSLGQLDANNSLIEVNGTFISIANYFRERYGITLKHPHWLLAQGSKKINDVYPFFPLELLQVADYQRVGNGNISPTDISAIVKACAVPPAVKRDEIENCFQSFNFALDGFMQKSGLKAVEEPLIVSARVLKPPQVLYANGGLDPGSNGKWRLPREAKFFRTIGLTVWCAYFLDVPGERMALGDFQIFMEKYYNECRHRGLAISPPVHILKIQCATAPIEDAFQSASENSCQFIFFGHSDRDTQMHSVIKGMERKYSIISQCVKTKTINNILKTSPLSLENIVKKTNIKLGGLNYEVVLDNYSHDPNVLFIGLGMNHPGMAPIPIETPAPVTDNKEDDAESEKPSSGGSEDSNFSILGFAANDGCNANEFIGNFFLQPMFSDNKVSMLDEVLKEVFTRFKQNRERVPSRVIIFRSGCSEGAYGNILRFEVPVITAMLVKYAPGAPLTVIVPSKMHSFRFFQKNINPSARSYEQNIQPGTVIDTSCVSSVFSEFFLNAHLAIQGTAKPVKYTILYSTEKDANLDMFERLTNALCYNFQIVTSPTSLPAPVYVAERYAERGRQILNTFATSGKQNIESENDSVDGSDGSGSNSIEQVPSNPFYLKSTEINFTRREYLRDKRVNA